MEIEKYTCCVCDKTFNNKSNVNRHLKLLHQVREVYAKSRNHQNVTCHRCQKAFFDKSTLSKHIKTAHNVCDKDNNKLKNKCLECKLFFKSKMNLIKHLVNSHNFKEDFIEEDFSSLEGKSLKLKSKTGSQKN